MGEADIMVMRGWGRDWQGEGTGRVRGRVAESCREGILGRDAGRVGKGTGDRGATRKGVVGEVLAGKK